jgi:hypothetical protein
MFSRVECGPENGGANWSAVRKPALYLMDSKRCFGIIRAALSLLKPVHDFPHNPKVAGSNPAPATNVSNARQDILDLFVPQGFPAVNRTASTVGLCGPERVRVCPRLKITGNSRANGEHVKAILAYPTPHSDHIGALPLRWSE